MWFVDDADELFDPFRTDEQALSFTHALADESVSVVFAVSTIRPIRIPEHCNTRIVFPCGERTSDLMAGVPARLLDMMSHIDADNAGRAVLIEGDIGMSGAVRFVKNFGFFSAKPLEKSPRFVVTLVLDLRNNTSHGAFKGGKQ